MGHRAAGILMDLHQWLIFVSFWLIFVLTPGPNALNCLQNGMQLGLRRALIGVAAILVQATAFLILSAVGISALILASPMAFGIAQLIGAGFLIWLGLRGWINAARPAPQIQRTSGSIFGRALAIAVINPKSVAGYLAAFSQFVDPVAPIGSQMWVIMPTALTITTLVYTGFTALGVGLGRAALGLAFHTNLRRAVAVGFIAFGAILGVSAPQMRGVL